MAARLDPRAWNLAAGVVLLAGCGSRSASSDANGESSGECTQSSDCPPGYYCVAGVCQYYISSDGHLDNYWYYECYTSEDCSLLQVCAFNYCESVAGVPGCEPPLIEPPTPLPIPEAPLALSFADLDDDGAEELVVASSTTLHVFEAGSDTSLDSLRELDSNTIEAMVAGRFDDMPGEDLVLLVGGELLTHLSDGAGSLLTPSTRAAPLLGAASMLGFDADGLVPTDLLLWRESMDDVVIDRGPGDVITLAGQFAQVASAREQGSLVPGIALAYGNRVDFLSLDGELLEGVEARTGGSGYPALAAINPAQAPLDLFSTSLYDWTLFSAWDPLTFNRSAEWGVEGRAQAVRAGDLDGDGFDELVISIDGGLTVHRGVLEMSACLVPLELGGEVVEAFVLGDHDGDGDDELAVRFEAGGVAMLDDEP